MSVHRTKWGQALQHRIIGRDFQKRKQAEIIKPEKKWTRWEKSQMEDSMAHLKNYKEATQLKQTKGGNR